jgi:hypothetical protein
MKENDFAVQVLNYSVYQEVLRLNDIFSYVTGKNLTFSYEFDHNDESNDEKTVSFNISALEKCQCLYVCQDFLLYQASQYPKTYSKFFRSILVERELDLEKFIGFGVNSVFSFLEQIPKKQSKKKKVDAYNFDYLSIQEGGGSGLGFQMYCDEVVVLSAGGKRFL